MIRETITPVALVKIESNSFIEKAANYNFDWFTLRREIELLSIFDESKDRKRLEESLKKYNSKHIQAPGSNKRKLKDKTTRMQRRLKLGCGHKATKE